MMIKIVANLLVVSVAAVPLLVLSQWGGLVICGKGETMCTIVDFFNQLNLIINFLIFYLAAPLAVLGIGWAGVQMLIGAASGNSNQIGKGKEVFRNVVWGFVFALGAYLIVKTIIWALAGSSPTGTYLKSLFK